MMSLSPKRADEMDDVPALLFGDDNTDAPGHARAGTAVSQHPHEFPVGADILPLGIGEIAGRVTGHELAFPELGWAPGGGRV